MRTALGTANVDQAKGSLNGARQAYTIGANDQLLTAPTTTTSSSRTATARPCASRMSPTPSIGREPVPGRLDGLLRAARHQGPPRRATPSLKPAVIVNIQRQPGANIIGVVDEVHKLLPQLRTHLPASVTCRY